MKRLRRTVVVTDQDGNPVLLGPGDDVPEWAASVITNPNVWDTDTDEDAAGQASDEDAAAKPAKRARAPRAKAAEE